MLAKSYVLCSVLLLSIFTISSLAEEGNEVLNLVKSNFSSFVESNHFSLIMFYAPWCGHSKTFAPTFDLVARELSAEGFNFAKVDCVAEESLYWSNNIEGFPTLKAFFGMGKTLDPIQYKGERELESLIDFARRIGGSALSGEALTAETFETFKAQQLLPTKPVLLTFAFDESGNKVAESVDYACKKLDMYSCVVSKDPKLAEALAVSTTTSSVISLRSFVNEPDILIAPSSVFESGLDLYNWMLSSAYPLLVEFNPENEPLLFSEKRPGFQIHIVTILDLAQPGSDEIIKAIRETAEEFTGKCVFVYIDTNNSARHVSRILADLEVDRKTESTAMIINSMKTKVNFYKLEHGTDINKDSIRHWVQQFFAEQLTPSRTALVQE